MEPIFSLGQWIKRRRRAHDLTQDALAQLVGCSPETIRKIEEDARRPSRQVAERIADHLTLAPDERAAFLQAARAELSVEHLAPPGRTLPEPAMVLPAALPQGTVTFLFTDVVGSTRLWQQYPQAADDTLARHEQLLRNAITGAGGLVFKSRGDGLCAAFASASAAVAAAIAGQRALSSEVWGATGPIEVRMALHTGVVEQHAGDYRGLALSRVAHMLAVAHAGQILLSHVTEELVRDQLPPGATLGDLGPQRLKDLARAEPLFQLLAPGLRADFPPLPTLDTRRTNLPAQTTALIGREREVAQVEALLRQPDVRLVTLTGPGGTGKTRLALHAAAELLDAHADGVYFVNLAPINDPAAVAPTIAQTLGMPTRTDQPMLALLKSYLRDRHLLLVLDNFEQVLDAALVVAELLTASPALQVLVTSRATLHLQGEHEFVVPPLALPNLHNLPPAAQLTQYAAVALFIDRARAADAGFAVTDALASTLAEICARLDGLPLAIELAAARAKLFPPEALLARLAHPLQLLTSGPRDLPARQQTLRNTIAWSYDLLNAGEQALFRRLAVFVGGCTLEAAQAVCNPDGALPVDVLDGLAALADKSLLRHEPGMDGAPRFLLLGTIREYALEQLGARDELEGTQRHHAAYFLKLATEDEPLGSYDYRDNAWYDRRAAELDNMRATLEWSHAAADGAEIEARLAAALTWIWLAKGMLREGQVWIERALMRRELVSTTSQARVLKAAGYLMFNVGAHAKAVAFFEQALPLWQQLDEPVQVADTLLLMGLLTRNMGDLERSLSCVNAALRLFQEAGREWGVLGALLALGDIAFDRHDFALAKTWFEKGLELAHRHGSEEAIGIALLVLGRVAYAEGDYARATSLYEESMRRGVAALNELGKVALAQANYAQAATLFRRCLQQYAEYLYLTLFSLEGLGAIAAERGDGRRAARLWGAVEAHRALADLPRDAVDTPDYERWVASAQARFDADAFAAAWQAGRALSLEEAVAEELAEGVVETRTKSIGDHPRP